MSVGMAAVALAAVGEGVAALVALPEALGLEEALWAEEAETNMEEVGSAVLVAPMPPPLALAAALLLPQLEALGRVEEERDWRPGVRETWGETLEEKVGGKGVGVGCRGVEEGCKEKEEGGEREAVRVPAPVMLGD